MDTPCIFDLGVSNTGRVSVVNEARVGRFEWHSMAPQTPTCYTRCCWYIWGQDSRRPAELYSSVNLAPQTAFQRNCRYAVEVATHRDLPKGTSRDRQHLQSVSLSEILSSCHGKTSSSYVTQLSAVHRKVCSYQVKRLNCRSIL